MNRVESNEAFSAELWTRGGKGSWHFLTLPSELAAQIRFFAPTAKGFMPIAVTAQIGQSRWETSVFPDAQSGSFLLAVKADVRKREKLLAGDTVKVRIKIPPVSL